MGLVYTEITLKNLYDIIGVRKGLMKDDEIRQLTVKALVDTGAWTLVINEAIREKLGLEVTHSMPGTLADGTRRMYNMASALEIWWKDRHLVMDAIVLPDAEDVLLGAIPLEAMDLTINPRTEQVVGAHGDEIMHSIKAQVPA